MLCSVLVTWEPFWENTDSVKAKVQSRQLQTSRMGNACRMASCERKNYARGVPPQASIKERGVIMGAKTGKKKKTPQVLDPGFTSVSGCAQEAPYAVPCRTLYPQRFRGPQVEV
eukprot:1157410-Pelagomonas_calceolata.AAC.3